MDVNVPADGALSNNEQVITLNQNVEEFPEGTLFVNNEEVRNVIMVDETVTTTAMENIIVNDNIVYHVAETNQDIEQFVRTECPTEAIVTYVTVASTTNQESIVTCEKTDLVGDIIPVTYEGDSQGTLIVQENYELPTQSYEKFVQDAIEGEIDETVENTKKDDVEVTQEVQEGDTLEMRLQELTEDENVNTKVGTSSVEVENIENTSTEEIIVQESTVIEENVPDKIHEEIIEDNQIQSKSVIERHLSEDNIEKQLSKIVHDEEPHQLSIAEEISRDFDDSDSETMVVSQEAHDDVIEEVVNIAKQLRQGPVTVTDNTGQVYYVESVEEVIVVENDSKIDSKDEKEVKPPPPSIPSHLLGRNINNPIEDTFRNGKTPPRPRLGVKIPYKNLTSQIVSKDEITREVLQRSKTRMNRTSKEAFFARQLAKRLAKKITPKKEEEVENPKSINNTDLIAILEGKDDEKQNQSQSKSTEEEKPISNIDRKLERELALKQLSEMPKRGRRRKNSGYDVIENVNIPPRVRRSDLKQDKEQGSSPKVVVEHSDNIIMEINQEMEEIHQVVETEDVVMEESVDKGQEIVCKVQENVDKVQENVGKIQESVDKVQEKVNKPQEKVIKVQEKVNKIPEKVNKDVVISMEVDNENIKKINVIEKKFDKKDDKNLDKKEDKNLDKKEDKNLDKKEDKNLDKKEDKNLDKKEDNIRNKPTTRSNSIKTIIEPSEEIIEQVEQLAKKTQILIPTKPEKKLNQPVKTYERKRKSTEDNLIIPEKKSITSATLTLTPSESGYVTKSSRIIKKKIIWDPDDPSTSKSASEKISPQKVIPIKGTVTSVKVTVKEAVKSDPQLPPPTIKMDRKTLKQDKVQQKEKLQKETITQKESNLQKDTTQKESLHQKEGIKQKPKEIQNKSNQETHKTKKRLTEVDKLLMDEGAVNLLYSVKNEDTKKFTGSTISLDKIEQDLRNKTNEIKKDLSNTSITDKISPKSLRKKDSPVATPTKRAAASISRKKSKDSNRSSIHSPPASPSLMIYPNHADASRIIRRHSSSSYSSNDGEENDEQKEKKEDRNPAKKKMKREQEHKVDNQNINQKVNDENFSKLVEENKINYNFDYSRFEKYKAVKVGQLDNLVQVCLLSNEKEKVYLTYEVLVELVDILKELEVDATCKVVVLNSTAPSFCHGIDYKSLHIENEETRKEVAQKLAKAVTEYLRALADFPKIIVAGVQGECIGLAVTMLPLFDMVLASETASFNIPNAKLGCAAEGGSLLSLPHLMPNALVSEMLYASRKFVAPEVLRFGLVTRAIWHERFQRELLSTVKEISTHSLQFKQITKRQLRNRMKHQIQECLSGEEDILLETWISAECQKNFENYD